MLIPALHSMPPYHAPLHYSFIHWTSLQTVASMPSRGPTLQISPLNQLEILRPRCIHSRYLVVRERRSTSIHWCYVREILYMRNHNLKKEMLPIKKKIMLNEYDLKIKNIYSFFIPQSIFTDLVYLKCSWKMVFM